MKIKCPHCNTVFDLEEKETSEKCKKCTWFEDDGYCGYRDSYVSPDDMVCVNFNSGDEDEEYKC